MKKDSKSVAKFHQRQSVYKYQILINSKEFMETHSPLPGLVKWELKMCAQLQSVLFFLFLELSIKPKAFLVHTR